MRRGVVVGAVVGALLSFVTACTAPPVVAPAVGEPGSRGPCDWTMRQLVNPADWRHAIWVLEPTGDAQPHTGGRCDDDSRPGAFVAHGYVGNFFEGYEGMLEHLASQGHVVVFPGYTTDFDPPHQYEVVDTGFTTAVAASGRIDLDRIGVVGHSFGGGMMPWLMQQAESRGWGNDVTWAVDMAPWYSLGVGTEAIDVPEHTRFTMVSYDSDVFVDTRIALETFAGLDLPEEQKRHVLVRSDESGSPFITADHLGPVSVEIVEGLGTISTDHLDHWSTYRTIDATAGCALDGRWCDTDLTDVGTWPDGRPVRSALVGGFGDVGPQALQECDFFLNPRRCP